MKIVILIVGLFFLISGSVFSKNVDYFANSTWLCIEDSGLGYNWNSETSEWYKVTNFKSEKFIFKTTNDSECNNPKPTNEFVDEYYCGTHYNFGEEPIFYDYYEARKYEGQSRIDGNMFSEFKMSDTGNFILSYGIPGDVMDKGFEAYGKKNQKDSMKLSIGKCSKL